MKRGRKGNKMAEQQGKWELLETKVDLARQYTEEALYNRNNISVDEFYPEFNTHYLTAQTMAEGGHFSRREMPVLNEEDIPGIKALMNDRHVGTKYIMMDAIDLIPLQKQIYLDKVISNTVSSGIQKTKEFLKSKHIFISEEGDILDGHHRWLAAMLIDPEFQMKAFEIKEHELDALKDMIEFSDEHEHERNA